MVQPALIGAEMMAYACHGPSILSYHRPTGVEVNVNAVNACRCKDRTMKRENERETEMGFT